MFNKYEHGQGERSKSMKVEDAFGRKMEVIVTGQHIERAYDENSVMFELKSPQLNRAAAMTGRFSCSQENVSNVPKSADYTESPSLAEDAEVFEEEGGISDEEYVDATGRMILPNPEEEGVYFYMDAEDALRFAAMIIEQANLTLQNNRQNAYNIIEAKKAQLACLKGNVEKLVVEKIRDVVTTEDSHGEGYALYNFIYYLKVPEDEQFDIHLHTIQQTNVWYYFSPFIEEQEQLVKHWVQGQDIPVEKIGWSFREATERFNNWSRKVAEEMNDLDSHNDLPLPNN